MKPASGNMTSRCLRKSIAPIVVPFSGVHEVEPTSPFDVIPGLTCTWQVSGRSNLPFDAQVLLDLDYIQKQSLAGDVALIARTVPAVLTGRGAH